MNRPAKLGLRSFLIGAAALLLIGALAWAIRQQSQRVNESLNEIADLRDPSPFRVALTGHLDKIHLSLLAYIKNPDPALVDRIKSSQADFERSLHEFETQSPRLFPAAARDQILQSYRQTSESLTQILETSRQRAEHQEAWQTNFDRFLFLIQNRLRPLSRRDREGAVARNESLLNLENQWRAWQQNLVQYWADPKPLTISRVQESEEKTDGFLNVYDQVASLAVERKQIRELRNLRFANMRLSRQIGVLQKLEGDMVARVDDSRKKDLDILTKTLPAMRPEELEQKKNATMGSVRLRTVAMAVMVLVGMLICIGAVLAIFRTWRRPAPSFAAVPASEATFEMDLKGNIAHWSSGAEHLYGFKAKEIEGQSVARLFASEDEIGHLYKELQSGQKAGFDARHKTKSGETFSARIEFQPTKNGIKLICTK